MGHSTDRSQKVVALVANTAWNVFNFRMNLLRGIESAGYQIVVMAPRDEYVSRVGFSYEEVPMDNRGRNPFKDLMLFLTLLRVYRKRKPNVILHFTIKPNIYGTFAARILGIPVINNIAGLGTPFVHKTLLSRIARVFYRFSQVIAQKVFFQNNEDRDLFLKQGIVREEQCDRLPGSGVDTEKFVSRRATQANGKTKFILVSRLLQEKGIREFAAAAKEIKTRYGNDVEFELVGGLEPPAVGGIAEEDISEWEQAGNLRYLGASDQVRDLIDSADCFVLPSYYREGVPRVLLEAASLGKPIITTDNVGCRDVVQHGINGYLCRVRDHKDLSDKMIEFVELPEDERKMMGCRSREIAVKNFDERIVINKYLDTIAQVIH